MAVTTAREFKAPEPVPWDRVEDSVFLAGSIEMGTAERWQESVASLLPRCTILNPRRDDWDSSWKQEPAFAPFREQVDWELDALDRTDAILLYLSPGTKSPISLLELGLFARSGKLFVACPPDFWRSGNVYIVCERYGVPCARSIAGAMLGLKEKFGWQ